MQDLFRPEAVEHHGRRLYGEIILASSLRSWVITCVIVLLLALVALALAVGSFPRKESVTGQIVAADGLAKAVGPEGSVITAVHIRLGDSVEKGDLLVSLQPALTLDDGSTAGERRLAELKAEETAILERSEALQRGKEAEQALLTEQARELDERSRGLQQLMLIEEQRITLADEIIKTAEPLLADGYITRLELQERRQAKLASESRLAELTLQAEEVAAASRKIRHQRVEAATAREAERAAIDQLLAALRGRMIDVREAMSPAVVATVSGTVVAVQAVPGERVSGPVALVTILPTQSDMVAELYVPTSAAGFLAKGQDVRLLMDAFPFQKFGAVDGKITGISAVAVEAAELKSSATERAFIVRVRPDRQLIDINGSERQPLRPGMTLAADLILEERAAWEALFAPFLRSLRR